MFSFAKMVHNLLACPVRDDSENQRAPDRPRNHPDVQERAADYESRTLEADELRHEVDEAFEHQRPKLREAHLAEIYAHAFSPSFRRTIRNGEYIALSSPSVRGVPPFFSMRDSLRNRPSSM